VCGYQFSFFSPLVKKLDPVVKPQDDNVWSLVFGLLSLVC